MERPIIMRDWEVLAILDGRKTQTRLPITSRWLRCLTLPDDIDQVANASPFGVPGDRLWVKETWGWNGCMCCGIHYRATEPEWRDETPYAEWKPASTMRREMSRITLEVVRVWVERVQEIHHDDAIAEGVVPMCVCEDGCEVCIISPRTHFQDAWESLYHSWSANPWVWSCEFRRIET